MLQVDIPLLNLAGFQLQKISFQIKKGSLLAIVGLNGSGKTTLLKTLSGIYTAPNIRILWKEKPLSFDKIEYIPPSLSIEFPISVYAFLEVSLEKIKITEQDKIKIQYIATLLNISPLLGKNMQNLSSGEITKVLLARALLRKARILLWDEPTSFLDYRYKKFLKHIFNKIKKNRLIIFSTHDYEWAMSVSNLFLFLKEGKMRCLRKKFSRHFL